MLWFSDFMSYVIKFQVTRAETERDLEVFDWCIVIQLDSLDPGDLGDPETHVT